MKKWIIALVLVLTAWFGLKNLALQAYLSTGEKVIPATLSYDAAEHWATQPETPPPGAWETPWGIDAFIVLPPANAARRHGLLPTDDIEIVTEGLIALQNIGAAIPGETPAYAPFYRAPSPANKAAIADEMNALASADLMSAFELYLAQANQGRGIMLIIADSAGPYTGPLLERLQSDALSSRFAGLISFGPKNAPYPEQSLICASVLNGACHQQVETKDASAMSRLLLPSLPRNAPALTIIDAPGVAAAIKVQAANVSTWMDETQPKPAEPFFTTTVIESAPIFRPGEDEPIDTSQED